MDQQSQQPTPMPATTEYPSVGRKKLSGRTKAALWLMIGPTALLITAFTLYVIVNFIFGSSPDVTTTATNESGELFIDVSNPGQQGVNIMNVLLFFVGAIVTLTWLPGLIIGIILLATKKQG